MSDVGSGFRARVVQALALIADGEAQRRYQACVPHVDVPAELFNQWEESYFPQDERFQAAFEARELDALRELNLVLNEVSDHTPRQLPALDDFVGTEGWRRLSEAAGAALRAVVDVAAMMPVVRAITSRWKSEKARLGAPVSTGMLSAFEERHDVRIPIVLRALLGCANGFEVNSADAEGFRFLPLEEYASGGRHPLGTHAILPSTRFVFVDYLQWSWAYAVEMGAVGHGTVYLIGTADGEARRVSSSIEEFLELYERDDSRLY